MTTATKAKATPTVATELRIVSRAFDAAGAQRVAGELVNVVTWRNAGYLEQLRYLRVVPAGIEPVPCPHKACTRQFIDEVSLAVHTPQHDAPKVAPKPARSRARAATADDEE